MNDFKNDILEKIKTGEIDMKPKWHFVLKVILMISGLILTALVAVYLLSFIFFTLHRSGILFAPGYGMKGLVILIMSSPWVLIVLTIIFLVALYLLVKHHAFSYKRPLLYSMLGVIAFVVVCSFAIERTHMHDRIQAFTERHNIPAAAPFYRTAVENVSDRVLYGTIESVSPDNLIVTTNKGEPCTVHMDSKTRQKPGSRYTTGERLLIYGERHEGCFIDAFGIRKVDEGFRKRLHIRDQEGQLMKPFQDRRPPVPLR